MWLDDGGLVERLVDRVRPYVFIDGDGETARMRLTEFGNAQKREREERERREEEDSTKRMRDRFIYRPTSATVERLRVKVGRMKIDEVEADGSTTRR
jgi:hypothetical protein